MHVSILLQTSLPSQLPHNNMECRVPCVLKYLECSYNQLTNLDVSGYTGLSQLFCNDNRLKSLDVNNN